MKLAISPRMWHHLHHLWMEPDFTWCFRDRLLDRLVAPGLVEYLGRSPRLAGEPRPRLHWYRLTELGRKLVGPKERRLRNVYLRQKAREAAVGPRSDHERR